jgi:hypothetical protein
MKCCAVWTIVAWLCGSSFAFAIPELTAVSNATVVVPNVNRTVEGGGGSGLLNTPLRHQIVYDASQFPIEIRITELRMRPSSVYGNAFTSTIPNLQINLSTTAVQPNQLDGTFAQNVGTNDTVVFQGPLTVSSRFVGPASGPREFDIIIPLMTPFWYDPSRGNLLIDFRNASGSRASLVDTGQHADDGASRVYALSVDATAASGADVGAEVIQIVYDLQGVSAPSIVSQPQSRSVIAGETVSLSVRAVGSTPLEYQWLKQGTAIAEATNAALTLANVQLADAGSYSVVVSNAYGAVTSQSAALTVSESSPLVVPNVNRTVDGGGWSRLLNWPLRHHVVYDNSLFPVEIMRIMELRLRPSGRAGNAFTATIPNLQINLSTTSVEPNQLNGVFAENVGTNDTVVFQGPLTVSSRFVGPQLGPKEFDIIIPLMTPFVYDSSRGNLLIDFRNASGSSAASLVDTGQRTDDGASRQFAASVNAISATHVDNGAEVFQIVYTGVAPSIVGQPQNRNVFVGETASLSVQAFGTGPLKYQWLKEGSGIPGGTNAVLALANVQLADAGNYSVVVSNAYGVVTSQSAALTLSENSALVVPNVNRTVDGDAGSGLLNTKLRHQVVYDDSLFPVELMRITELRLRPSARFGNAFTATISNLQINLSTTSIEPNSLSDTFTQNVGTNDTVVFQGPLTVSSRFVGPVNGPKEFDIIIPLTNPFLYDPTRGNLLIDFRNASGSGASLIDIGRRTDDGASRRFATSVDATSSTGADAGAEVFQLVYTMHEGLPPSISGQPQSRNVFAGETASLSVQATGTPPLIYQWLKEGTPIAVGTNTVLTFANVQPSDAAIYSVVVSNAYGIVTSQSGALTLSESSALVVPTVNRTVDGGGGSGLLNTPLRQQTVYDDSLFPDEIMRITELRLRPSARFGNAFSATISNLQINLSTTSVEPDQLSRTLLARNVGADEVVVFQGPLTLSSRFVGPANGPKEFDIIIPLTTPFLYDRSRGNLLIDFRNASSSSASLVDIGQRSDDGASRVFATSTPSTGADSAADVFQIVYTPQTEVPPLIFAQPPSRSTFLGETVTFTVGVLGSPPLNYQWARDGVPIPDATNAILVLTNVNLSQAGNYSVVVSNAFGVATSQTATLTVPEASVLVVPTVNSALDGGSGTGLLNRQLRQQIIYDDSLFPDEIMRITELRMRPSARFGNAFTATISNLQINLSTTSVEPDHLNSTFAQNVGTDDTVVFQGSLTVSSRFVGPTNGPKEFDIVIPLLTPFLYDPSRGNLLIDFRNASDSSASLVDTGQRSDDGASRVFATSVAATSSTRRDSAAEVFQIVYTTANAPSIVLQPQSRSVLAGETASLSVQAAGKAPLKYQWLKGDTAITGATNAVLTFANVQPGHVGSYSVVVSNNFGVVRSQSAMITISEGVGRSECEPDGGGRRRIASAEHTTASSNRLRCLVVSC